MRAAKQQRHREKIGYLASRVAKYGITAQQYLDMLASQGGCCAICRDAPSGKQALCVDHNHSTGEVRGLLCKTCNLAVGNLRDSAELASLAAAYLGRKT